jgi:hypothetical protein
MASLTGTNSLVYFNGSSSLSTLAYSNVTTEYLAGDLSWKSIYTYTAKDT